MMDSVVIIVTGCVFVVVDMNERDDGRSPLARAVTAQ